jgi:phosphoadenosine phosphosulfate reductase
MTTLSKKPSSRSTPSTTISSTSSLLRLRTTANSKPSLRCSAAAKLDVDAWASSEAALRSAFLEEQARRVLRRAAEQAQRPAFPCALIAGDIVILSLLASENLLGKIPVIFIDTFHLFPETHALLSQLEELYKFKAKVFRPAGFATKDEYVKKHGSDLFLTDIDEYDRICKVEPFGRSLKELNVDAMINGRRRDHGAERAHLQLVDAPARPGAAVNVQPLAWWEFEDCMRFLEDNNVPKHPLFDQGYPSVGDVHSTLPVPKEKWFEYAGERSGRFVGLTNADGSTKTECGE